MKTVIGIKTIYLFILMFCLQSCVSWADGSPGTVWDDGKWLIPWALGLAGLFFWIQTIRGHFTPEVRDNPATGKRDIPTGRKKTPVNRVVWFPYALGLTIATIAVYVYVSIFER